MKRVLAILAAATFPVLAAVTVVSFAQQPQPTVQSNIVMKQRVMQGPDGIPPPGGDIFFMDTEVNFGGKTVKGAPYSAQAVTETIQTLSDGNRIVNKLTSQLYRDSEGRTRREQTIKFHGEPGDGAEPLQTVFINDPVSGSSYVLDSKSHSAVKTGQFKIERHVTGGGVPGGIGVESQRFEFKVEGGPGSGVVVKTPDGGPPPPGLPGNGPGVRTFKIESETAGGGMYIFRRGGSNENEVKEQLGKQIIEGVEAEGNRSTITIPAGEIGNDRPIEIVSESWYSPELQMVIMTRHSDPRSGETTYRLTNINRTEPAKTLFEVPADYTVKEGFHKVPTVMTMPTKPRKPE